MENYYPFGLTFNSLKHDNSEPQDYKYNGKELQDELNLSPDDWRKSSGCGLHAETCACYSRLILPPEFQILTTCTALSTLIADEP
jgi:hypothetical protein